MNTPFKMNTSIHALINELPTIGYDMALKGRNLKKLWCSNCKLDHEILGCECGLTGQCGRGGCAECLDTESLEKICCERCGFTGGLDFELDDS